jgi:hypothetical protein
MTAGRTPFHTACLFSFLTAWLPSFPMSSLSFLAAWQSKWMDCKTGSYYESFIALFHIIFSLKLAASFNWQLPTYRFWQPACPLSWLFVTQLWQSCLLHFLAASASLCLYFSGNLSLLISWQLVSACLSLSPCPSYPAPFVTASQPHIPEHLPAFLFGCLTHIYLLPPPTCSEGAGGQFKCSQYSQKNLLRFL